MVNKPELTVRGKKLIIQLNEKLRDDLTYVINFGSAVVDIRENNPVIGLSYVFSTGAAIDSLLIAGKILHAFDLEPAGNILFSVYQPEQDTLDPDSMFLKVPPLSAIRTLEDGTFRLTNLPGGKYLAYGLEDLNSNFYYDLPTEKIAFIDSLIIPEYLPMEGDTADIDSTTSVNPRVTGVPQRPVTLYLFQEFDPYQRILSSAITKTGSIELAFRLPLKDIEITPLNFPADPEWMIREYNLNRDTLILWPNDYERDTFKLILNLGDTIIDTVTLARRIVQSVGLQRRRITAEDYLQFNYNISAGILAPGKNLVIEASEPLTGYDFTGLRLYQPEDTLRPDAKIIDSLSKKIEVLHEWKENSKYRLYLPDSVIIGISGKSNDSIAFNFRTRPIEDYGSLIMNYQIGQPEMQYIVELLNDKDVIIRRDTVNSDRAIHYRYLDTGTYRFKAIEDRNGNGTWDTGNLLQKKLPESIFYFSKDIAIRSNWELQETWLLGK
jgi:uncharacterized protein (DUF2141 family)